MSTITKQLPFTGERFTPECVREIAYEHWHRYAWVTVLTNGKNVLDVACGEGYGSYLLAEEAHSVTGIDVDSEAVKHAQRRYIRPNLEFVQADALSLPVESGSIDIVVSFETIEHLDNHDALLTEFRRVLHPRGKLVLSSPDKASYSDDSGYSNPFHVRELYRAELEELLERHFENHYLFAQKLLFASAIWPLSENMDSTVGKANWLTLDEGRVDVTHVPRFVPQYFLAIATMSKESDPMQGLSLYSDIEESVYQHYRAEIQHHISSADLLRDLEQEISILKAKLAKSWWHRFRSLFGAWLGK